VLSSFLLFKLISACSRKGILAPDISEQIVKKSTFFPSGVHARVNTLETH